ncbi:MAG: ankyrin repeat domain-containing protein [Spirochaetaceae bacterium]|jgi:hypothetical protein|nr:ankyrin repeat domain-containing protein [Spirochaetaceae bacterium]
MEIAVLHREEEAKTARALVKLVKKHKIPVSAIAVGKGWAGSGALEDSLSGSMRYIVILPPEGFSSPWVSYLAGFCRPGALPLIVYGPPQIYPGALFSHAKPIATEAEFAAFLEAELPGWKQRADFEEAREALLGMGIPYGEEAFAQCAREGKAGAVKRFLQGGLSPNIRDRAGVPLLSLASRAGDLETAAVLIEAGAEVNAVAQDRGGPALIDCALGKHRDIAALLLDAGADLNLKSKDGQSALIISVGLADENLVELLLRAGADADAPDALGASARRYAALFNKPNILELFEKYAGT